MVKRLTIIIALVIVLAAPSISTAFGNYFGKSLCDFPFGTYGTFSVYYDQRLYHPDYYAESYPNGGIKFELFLGIFDSAEARDDLISQIYWIRYTNKSTGSTYIVKTAFKFLYLGSPTGEYSIWHGHSNVALGDWVVRVITKTGIYRGSFTITQDMVDQEPAVAVEPFIEDIPGSDLINITANHTNGDYYRFRVIDSEGNFTSQDTWYTPSGCDDPATPCTMSFQYPETGDMFRIETRKTDQEDWPLLTPGVGCVAYDMNPGQFSRSSIVMKLELLSDLPE